MLKLVFWVWTLIGLLPAILLLTTTCSCRWQLSRAMSVDQETESFSDNRPSTTFFHGAYLEINGLRISINPSWYGALLGGCGIVCLILGLAILLHGAGAESSSL